MFWVRNEYYLETQKKNNDVTKIRFLLPIKTMTILWLISIMNENVRLSDIVICADLMNLPGR